ncbi:CLUMA_CG001991, isoform A, partial [Clunio marinus]
MYKCNKNVKGSVDEIPLQTFDCTYNELVEIKTEAKSSYLKAFEEDNFIEFKKLIKKSITLRFLESSRRRTHQIFTQPTEVEMSDFEEILQANKYAAKYISFVLEYFQLYNDELFVSSKNKAGKTLIYYVGSSKNIENLLSFLIFDWFNLSGKKSVNYALVIKGREFKNAFAMSLFEKLYEILEDESNKIFHEICMRVIYQFLHEVSSIEATEEFFEIHDLCIDKVFKLKNQKYLEKILQIFVVFLIENESEIMKIKDTFMSVIKSEEMENFFRVAFLLKEGKKKEFQRKLATWIESYEKIFGKYHKVILKPHLQLLFNIVKRLNMNSLGEFMLRKYSFLGVNYTIVEIFHDQQDFQRFIISQPKFSELNELSDKVTENNFTHCDLNEILNDYMNYDNKEINELKTFIFGRNIANNDFHNETIFEQILSTPNASNTIELIWKVFKLKNLKELLIF